MDLTAKEKISFSYRIYSGLINIPNAGRIKEASKNSRDWTDRQYILESKRNNKAREEIFWIEWLCLFRTSKNTYEM